MTAINLQATWGLSNAGTLMDSISTGMLSLPSQNDILGTQASNWQSGAFVLRATDIISKELSNVIGRNGINRFNKFMAYQDGWDGINSKPVSPLSIASMETFVAIYGDKIKCKPSIFLSREGNLMLGWEDDKNGSIELEFGVESISYYIETADIEDEEPLSKQSLDSLAEILF